MAQGAFWSLPQLPSRSRLEILGGEAVSPALRREAISGSIWPIRTAPLPAGLLNQRHCTREGGALAALSLQKGVRFIARVHDPNQLLPQVETAPDTLLFVTSVSVKQFPLPVVYADDAARDYRTVVPTKCSISAAVSSATLALADTTRAAPSPTPMRHSRTNYTRNSLRPKMIIRLNRS